MEEQLRTVQKQLQALSQLPSAIQLTLDAVSKQLASIVSAKEDSEEINEDNDDEKNEENDGQMQEELERIEEGNCPLFYLFFIISNFNITCRRISFRRSRSRSIPRKHGRY